MLKLDKEHATMIVSVVDRRNRMVEEFQRQVDEVGETLDSLLEMVLEKYEVKFDSPLVRIMQDGVYVVNDDATDDEEDKQDKS